MKEKLTQILENIKNYVRENKKIVKIASTVFIVAVALVVISFSINKIITARKDRENNEVDIYATTEITTDETEEPEEEVEEEEEPEEEVEEEEEPEEEEPEEEVEEEVEEEPEEEQRKNPRKK